MRKNIFYTFLLFLSFITVGSYANPGAIVGTWLSASGEAKIEIYKTGNKYFGKIIWIQEPNDEKTGKPKTDSNNPDKSAQNKPIVGLEILKNFDYIAKDNAWKNGTIYDPKSGKTYKCNITLKGSDQMNIRGFIGVSLLGRTETWEKVKDK